MTALLKNDLPEVPRLSDLAEEACAKYTEIGKAKKMVLNRLKAQPEIRDAWIEEMVTSAVQTALYRRRSYNLSVVKTRSSSVNGETLAAMSGTFTRSFLRIWTMPDGRVLADYTGEELKKEAAANKEASNALWRKAEFYSQLAKLAKDKTVAAAVGDAKAEEIWKAIE